MKKGIGPRGLGASEYTTPCGFPLDSVAKNKKVKKVAKALHGASKKHKAQAEILDDYIKETKESLEFNTKKIEILDKEIQEIKEQAEQKIGKLQKDRNQIVSQIIKEQGGLEKLEKLINVNNKVES